MNRIQEISKEDVVSLSVYKRFQETVNEEKTMKAYYKLLGFNQLVSEANTMIIEIQNRTMNDELALRSKTIVAEFKRRTGSSHPLMAQALGQISKNIEKNINLLTDC